jgi:hypothetical protein
MTLTEFYNEVSRHTDTDSLKIGASETKRVLAVMFTQLAKLDSVTAFDIIARGLENAKNKEGKA